MKRSSQVALLLMGVTTAGATSYALIPSRDCAAPNKPAAIAPGAINSQTLAPAAVPCDSGRRSWGSRWYWNSRSSGNTSGWRSFFSGSSGRTSGTSSGGIGSSRGGFGGFGRSFSMHSSGS